MSRPIARNNSGASGGDARFANLTLATSRVGSGPGTGKRFVTLPGFGEQFEARLGIEPYPGTLNDGVANDRAWQPLSESHDPVELSGGTDGDRSYGATRCYRAALHPDDGERVRSEGGHVIDPFESDHDADTSEVNTPSRLRDYLGIEEGDQVHVHVGEL